jgi:hypothetical protein
VAPLLLAAMILAALAARTTLRGRAALREADASRGRGDALATIAWSLRAAEAYVPLTSHPARAYEHLRTIAIGAEQRGDVELALVAWQAIRTAVRATTSVFTPYRDRLVEADDHLATILAQRLAQRLAQGANPGVDRASPADRVEALRGDLARDEADGSPHPLAVVATNVGLIAFFAGAWTLLADASRRVKTDRAARWYALLVGGGALYAIGLWLA